MINEIMEAIDELLIEDCKREDLIICLNPLSKRIVIQELSYISSNPNTVYTALGGVRVDERWPYNEVVVYDTVNVYYHPKLIRKIPFNVKVVTEANITEVSLLPGGGFGIGYVDKSK